jgi:hypothetical protein
MIELRCSRVLRPELGIAVAPWSCAQCAHELATASTLGLELDAIRRQTCDELNARVPG